MKFLVLTLVAIAFSHTCEAVQGGGEVDSRDPLASTAISLGEDSSGTLSRSFCSGVLISNSAIVTAAHCLAGKNATTLIVEFGSNGLLTSVFRPGTEIDILPSYQPYGDALPNARNNSDIAVLKFSGGIPDGFAPVKLDRSTKPLTTGSSIMIGGFGTPHSGVLNACQTTLLDGSFTNSEIELKSSVDCTPDVGDSGGPDYRIKNGEVVLYGIHNWGWPDDAGNPSYSVEARIAYFWPWLDQVGGNTH